MNATIRYASAALLFCAAPARAHGQDPQPMDVVALAKLVEAWGPCSPPCPYDLDGNLFVDANDLRSFVETVGHGPARAARPNPFAKARLVPVVNAINLTPELMTQAMHKTLTQPPSPEEERVRRWLLERRRLTVRQPPGRQPLERTDAQPDPAQITDVPSGVAPEGPGFLYAPRMTRNFVGIDEVAKSAGVPPDPDIAAGPSHAVITVNSHIKVFTKQGQEVFFSSLFNFFQLMSGFPGPFDPRLIFDEESQRFFVMALANDGQCPIQSWWYVGVSQTSNPLQGWWIYLVPNDWQGNWVDYPFLGVSDRAAYLLGQYIAGPCPTASLHNTNWVLDKGTMIGGSGIAGWITDDLTDADGFSHFNIRATITYGVPSAVEAFALTLPGGLINGQQKCVLWGITLPPDFPMTEHSFGTSHSVTIPTPPGPPVQAEQKGGPGLIDVNRLGSPALDAVYQNGRVWTCSHYRATGMPARDLLRYFELNVSGWPTLSITSMGDFWDGISYYYWPDITANHHGDVAMVFSRSRRESGQDLGEYPGSRWTVRLADETSLNPSNWLAPGEHYNGDEVNDPKNPPPVYRWGDYSGTAVDPTDHGFWVFHEYCVEDPKDPAKGRWRTQIGYMPRAVFVNGAYAGSEAGTRPRPFNTVGEGHAAALSGNDLVIKAGNYPEAVTLNKALAVMPDGGLVRIGE